MNDESWIIGQVQNAGKKISRTKRL